MDNITLIKSYITNNSFNFIPIRCRSSVILKNFEFIYNDIINVIDKDIAFKEKLHLYINNKNALPLCYCGNAVKFKR